MCGRWRGFPSPLTTFHSPLTTHHFPHTTHHSLLTTIVPWPGTKCQRPETGQRGRDWLNWYVCSKRMSISPSSGLAQSMSQRPFSAMAQRSPTRWTLRRCDIELPARGVVRDVRGGASVDEKERQPRRTHATKLGEMGILDRPHRLTGHPLRWTEPRRTSPFAVTCQSLFSLRTFTAQGRSGSSRPRSPRPARECPLS